ncbi:MAG: thioredoxin domain-containing protein, partial [Phycisphaerales bacterium]
MPPHEPPKANRLAGQTSPYLLQHAHNPVDWWPWTADAFAEARRRDVPIFLSIGYSTCYWCHVMERESFENAEIGRLMNERFVCIKVDREERPDVDDLYMAAVQAFSGHGGWPMSVFLEPVSLKPFWAGTYFPAERKYQNMPSFPQVLTGISRAWNEEREDVLRQAEELAEAVRERLAARSRPVRVGEAQVIASVAALLRSFDRN